MALQQGLFGESEGCLQLAALGATAGDCGGPAAGVASKNNKELPRFVERLVSDPSFFLWDGLERKLKQFCFFMLAFDFSDKHG